jgi:hypothetical protein
MRRLLEEQRNNPHAHRNAVDDQGMPEKPGLPLKPIITTIKLENKVWDYHNKVDWSNVMVSKRSPLLATHMLISSLLSSH